MPCDMCQTEHKAELNNIQNVQEKQHLFFPSCFMSSKTDIWTDKDLGRKAKELYKLLKSCKYGKQRNESTGSQVTNNTHSCCSICEDDCSCKDSDLNFDAITLDVDDNNKQFKGEVHVYILLASKTY